MSNRSRVSSTPIRQSPTDYWLLKYVQAVEAEKVLVGRDGAPARVGVARGHGESHLADFARVRGGRARVVDEPVRRALVARARAAEEEHDVVRVLLNPRLVEEEEVAGLGLSRVAADEVAVELLERARVGELGEGAVREVRFLERAGDGAEEFLADGAALQRVGAHVGRHGVVSFAHPQQPRAVVLAQSLAPTEAHQPGAVALPLVPLPAGVVELRLGDGGEPLAEALAVAVGAELD